MNFEVGDMVLSHLRKKRFPRGEYNKLKIKRISPCKILCKFSTNDYELELPIGIGISPIFNVADLYPSEANNNDSSTTSVGSGEVGKQKWIKKMPTENALK